MQDGGLSDTQADDVQAAKEEVDAESAIGIARLLNGLTDDCEPADHAWMYIACLDVCSDGQPRVLSAEHDMGILTAFSHLA